MESSKPAVTTPQSESQYHFLDYWRIIRIRKTVILAVFLLVVVTTTAVTFVLKPIYASTVRMAVEKDYKDITPLGQQQIQAGFDPYFIETEFQKIQSTTVLYEVLDKLSPPDQLDPEKNLLRRWAERYNEEQLTKQEAYQILRRNLDVRQARNTSLIEVRVYSEDKQEAKDIADAIAEVYKTSRVRSKKQQTEGAIRELEKQYEEQTNKVATLAAELDRLRTELGIPDSGTDSSASYQISVEREAASAAGGQLVLARTELVFYEKTLESLLSLSRADLREAIPTVVQAEQLLPQLLTDLSAVEVNLATARKDYQDEHPDVQRLLARKETLERQIEARLTGILTGLSNKVVSLSGRVAELEHQVQQVKLQVAEEAKRSRSYWQLKRKLENEQRIADALQLRLTQERVDSALPTSSIVEIVDRAEVGLNPVRPKLILNIALGVVVGLIMGVGLAFFIEYLDTSVKTIDDVERSLQTPVIGVIPQNVGLLMDEGPDSPHAEAYRVLRTNVLFSRKNPQYNTLTVVSGGAGEGKSTTIFNLATVFAQNGARVLVVDSDLRRPSLHKFLNVSNSVGLTNFLLKQNSLEEVVQTTKLPTLDFLPSGKLPSSALGLLNSTRMQDFIKDVKQRYDFVFFDSPPIMGVSDASILASEVDLAILVVQYRKYPQAINLRAKQMVEKVGGNLLGVVLNNINISQDSYYYYYSGYYYDYYSKDDSGDGAEPKVPAEPKTETASAKAGQLEQKF